MIEKKYNNHRVSCIDEIHAAARELGRIYRDREIEIRWRQSRRSHTYIGILVKKLITWDSFGVWETLLSVTIIRSTVRCGWLIRWFGRRTAMEQKDVHPSSRHRFFFTCNCHCWPTNYYNSSRTSYLLHNLVPQVSSRSLPRRHWTCLRLSRRISVWRDHHPVYWC